MDKQTQVKILNDLIKIQSVNDNEGQVAEYLRDLFQAHNIKTRLIEQFPGRSNIIAEIGNGEHPKLGFSGHLDVVHPGELDSWDSDPFDPAVKDGRFFGRGTSDMKGGIAQLAIAMIEIAEHHPDLKGTIRFIGTISEELTEEGSKLLAEKGYVDDLDAMVIAEPSGVSLHELKAYFNSGGVKIDPDVFKQLMKSSLESDAREQHFIIKAHKGWMAYRVTAMGKAAHSSMPKMGINAVDCLIRYYLAEKELYKSLTASDPELGETVYSPDIFKGGEQVNSVPDKAYEIVKVRTIPEIPNDELIQKLKNLIIRLNAQPGMHLKLDVEYSEYPVKSDDRTHIIEIFQQNAKETMHEPMALPTIGVSLGTDASEFKRRNPNIDTIIIGVGNTSAHCSNEYIDLAAYFDMTKLYIKASLQFLNDNQSINNK